MNATPSIRRYQCGEESLLLEIFQSAIRLVASQDYSPAQIEAWAPQTQDPTTWAERIRAMNPFVAELNNEIVGYADLQTSGYIDHFFVSGHHARRGIGSYLMNHLLAQARIANLPELTSDVSRTAQAFFEKFGFVVVEYCQVERRGIVIPNARMKLLLASDSAITAR